MKKTILTLTMAAVLVLSLTGCGSARPAENSAPAADAQVTAGSILYYQGSVIAANIVDYRSESQQSVEFSMKEYQNIGGSNHWIPFFPPSSRIRGIDDDLDDIHLNNTSVLNNTLCKPQKLILSSYIRRFPEGVSTYKFGVIASVDLSSKISDMVAQQK